jgi:hypothetical protein
MSTRSELLVTFFMGSLLVTFAGTSSPQPLPRMTPDQWRSDIDFFARELPKRHKNAFHAVGRDTFDRTVADLRAKVDKALDDEVVVGLLQITAMIGDGHTHVNLPPSVHRLPVAIVLFGGDYRITRTATEAAELLGGKIVRIDETPILEVEKRLRSVISQDESEPFLRGALPSYILVGEILHGLQITRDATHARITVATEAGEKGVDVVTVPGASNPMSWQAATKETPLFRQHVDDPLFVTYIERSKAVYVNFRKYDDLGSRSRDLWKLVDAKPVEKIVIDLRQNGGGDYKVGRKYLVGPLKQRPKLKAFVLVGNRTFSAAMNNAIDFRDDAHAILVGEPIGEKPNSYQENDEMTLPQSRIVVSYSTRFYKFLPDDAPPIVTPDKVIAPTWDDFVAGRDPVLDWVLAR